MTKLGGAIFVVFSLRTHQKLLTRDPEFQSMRPPVPVSLPNYTECSGNTARANREGTSGQKVRQEPVRYVRTIMNFRLQRISVVIELLSGNV
jgi:hypothetical protein